MLWCCGSRETLVLENLKSCLSLLTFHFNRFLFGAWGSVTHYLVKTVLLLSAKTKGHFRSSSPLNLVIIFDTLFPCPSRKVSVSLTTAFLIFFLTALIVLFKMIPFKVISS